MTPFSSNFLGQFPAKNPIYRPANRPANRALEVCAPRSSTDRRRDFSPPGLPERRARSGGPTPSIAQPSAHGLAGWPPRPAQKCPFGTAFADVTTSDQGLGLSLRLMRGQAAGPPGGSRPESRRRRPPTLIVGATSVPSGKPAARTRERDTSESGLSEQASALSHPLPLGRDKRDVTCPFRAFVTVCPAVRPSRSGTWRDKA
jgi:hypothetical protein